MKSKTETRRLISEALVRWRKKKNLTMKVLTEKVGINLRTYQSYENGLCEPSIRVLIRLAGFYQITLEDLIGFHTIISE